ncbi:hypothetical protein ACFQY7_38375 [Actinomadura luteofluorescens]|uniref:hypothetical protein n=1 Tax=Actinomadura luteofluorescens TaxID=46163 RepID=UPI003640E325
MADLNGRLRRALPIGAVLLGAPSASLGSLGPLAPAASLPGWALPAAVASGVATGIAIILFTTVGGGPGEDPRAAPPPATPTPASSAPADVAQPDYTVGTRTPGSASRAQDAAVPRPAQARSACGTRRCNRAWRPTARRSFSAPAPTRRLVGSARTPAADSPWRAAPPDAA